MKLRANIAQSIGTEAVSTKGRFNTGFTIVSGFRTWSGCRALLLSRHGTEQAQRAI